jgi:hypothetical protein
MVISLLLLGMLLEHLHISFKIYWNDHFTIVVGHAFGASQNILEWSLHYCCWACFCSISIFHSKHTGMVISLLLLGMLLEHLHISFKIYWNAHFTIVVGHAFGASPSEYTKKLHINHYSTYLIIHFKL